MPNAPGDELAQATGALAELGEYLEKARVALDKLPRSDDSSDAQAQRIKQALYVAQAAVTSFGEFAAGLHYAPASDTAITLLRDGNRVFLYALGTPTQADVATFCAALSRLDQRLLASAELLGLLIGLAIKWAAASFAPPIIVKSLIEAAPRILELGAKLHETL